MEFLTASFQVIFEKIIDFTIGVVGRQIRYPIDYKKNTDNLGTQVKEIEDARDDVERRVEVARRNVEQIEGKVRRWLTDVEEITAKVGKFFEDDGQAKMKCCNGQCPNLKARYKLSKRAYKLGLEVKEIMGKGNFSTVGYRVPIGGIGIEISTKGYEHFESRRSIFEGVMKALKDDNIRAIGVYGMGGTGKTMLVGEVATQAMKDKDMDAQEIFPVGVLLDNEATYLFRKIVGDLVETLDFQSIVVEVIEECGGLPIALTAVAHALKSEKAQNVWKDALRQLRMANPIDIEGMHEKVYPSIKLSYNVLSKEAQSLFLFCSTFQEDVDIPIEFLWRLLVGLDFFEDVFTMEEVRNKVYTLVGKLKACCLLLEGEESGTVKMHDVIRDVSIYIADKDKQMLTIRSSDNLKKLMNPKVLEDSILMALYDFDSSELPERLECPQVKLIILERQRDALQIPNTFFEGVKNLKVLVLSRVCLTKLPSSLLFLDNLQTLYLIDCELEDIAMIGELKNLNALSLSGSNIRQLPKEIEQLTDLKLLDLTNYEDFPKLKYLKIKENAELQYIISWTGVQRVAFPLLESISLKRMIKLEKICHGQLAEGSFGNLRKLKWVWL
uniref:Uncharacterized protein n=1 Tax=Fagus sylvatica TaxID=28930 RepID=A0A2N9FYF0_FAGSY